MSKEIENCYFFIPARKGSEGLRLKNRKLLHHTINSIPKEYRHLVYISTDDERIKQISINSNIKVIDRPTELATSESSVLPVIQHFIDIKNIPADKDIILLYLTYPERTWDDIISIYQFYKKHSATSLVCAEQIDKHPYLCFYEEPDLKGGLVVDHKLYRRQDYPKCFKISLFVACYKSHIVNNNMHDLLVEPNTIFYKLNKTKIDIDSQTDFNLIKEKI